MRPVANAEQAGARRQTLSFACDWQRIREAKHGSLMIRLMMAANDILLANWGMLRYQDKELPRLEGHVRPGAVQYFVRLQCSHLCEGMKMIREVRDTRALADRVGRCLPETRTAFQNLVDCLNAASRHADFNRWVARLRNKIGFHYDPDHVELAITQLSDRARERRPATMPSGLTTMGRNVGLPRFTLADTAANEILIRQILSIPAEADTNPETEALKDFVNQTCVSFLRFVNEYAVNYLREYARLPKGICAISLIHAPTLTIPAPPD